MIDFDSLLYAQTYATFGTTATGLSADITVIDDTEGVAIPDKTGIETVRPVARVRASELALAGITIDSLAENVITFNGGSWRIKAARQMANKNGVDGGQVMLILLSEG